LPGLFSCPDAKTLVDNHTDFPVTGSDQKGIMNHAESLDFMLMLLSTCPKAQNFGINLDQLLEARTFLKVN
jgi:hypothetical protein